MSWSILDLSRSLLRRATQTRQPLRKPNHPRLALEALEERMLLDSGLNQLYMKQVYRDLLGRQADSGGLASWTAQLDQGISRVQVVLDIEGSQEYRTKLVDSLYTSFLHRDADPGGQYGFVSSLGTGISVEPVEAVILGSPEYFQTRAGGTNAGFLSAFYQDVLARPIDPTGAASWSSKLLPPSDPSASSARTFVAGGVLGSVEAEGDLVKSDYLHFLRRAAESGGLNGWIGALQSGMRDQDLLARIVGSDEYFVKATSDKTPPTIVIVSPATGLTTQSNVTVTGQVTDDFTGVATLQAQVDSGSLVNVPFDSSGAFSYVTTLPVDGSADGKHTVSLQSTDNSGNMSNSVSISFTLDTSNASAAAPPVDRSVVTSLASATQFLYTGSNPVQKGVAANTIQPAQVAVLRGSVQKRDGSPLAEVAIGVLNHPEFGSTRTDLQGMFNLAVNGGGLLTVTYSLPGYLPVQRQIQTPWQDYALLPSIVMLQPDSGVSAIDLTASTPIQVARGSVERDASGTRQGTLFFPQGTQATMTLADGTKKTLSTLHVRITEYSVGSNGPAAMPANLPPNSGYTYAVDFNTDESLAAGDAEISFSQPLPYYFENFINLPVGQIVPLGNYDPALGIWTSMPNGRIVKVLSITNGMADLDIDGSGMAAGTNALATLGITDAERGELAQLYQPGQSLWRMLIPHFTSPFDS